MSEAIEPANVVPLRPAETIPAAPPVVVPDEAGKRRPIIPEPLQRGNLSGTVRQAAGLQAYRTAYHGLRLPWHVLSTSWYALVGAQRITARLAKWWHWTDGWLLESQAVAAGRAGHNDALRAHTTGKATRSQRGKILAACVALAAVLGVAAWWYVPAWGWIPPGLVLVLVLARHGKPEGKPLFSAAVVPVRYEPPTPAIITRALNSLGIPQINAAIKDGPGIRFMTDVHRDGPGWGTRLELPHGVTATQILAKRESLASGLRRPLSATWPEPVPHEHAGMLDVWIGFQDISKTKPPAYPLLRSGTADLFASVPFGTDPRCRPVAAPMFEVNWLIGAAPGQGKTSTVRVLACAAALDPLADLWIHELAGKGDLEPLAKVCHRYTSGLDDEAIGYAADSVRMLRDELERRSVKFKKIPREARPDGKLTRELAGKRGERLRPLVCFLDEGQNLFMHPKYGDQAADDAGHVIRVGRAYGIILVISTQRPDRDAVPPQVTGNVTARFCLQVPGQVENDMVLGTSSYKNGYNATAFRPKADAGLGWLKAEGTPQVVRTYYLDLNATERVAARARAMREQAGVLSGYALGEQDAEPARDFLADVLSVFGGEANLWAETIAARLAGRIAGGYAGITKEAVASQLRALGVPVKQVREAGAQVKTGCARSDVEAAQGAGHVLV